MANTPYPNYVLANKFEDQYQSYLDLMNFVTVDNSLVGVPGMKKKIRVYKATDGNTETLAMGEGNTKAIEVGYTEEEYEVELLQNRFMYYDEEAMTDPLIIDKGLGHQAVDMFNTANAKAMAEFQKATLSVTCTKFDFDAFVDGVAAFPKPEQVETGGLGIFGLVHKNDVAEIRKNLKDQLSYVEAYVRTGYIGTINSVNLYVSKIATAGTIILATKDAVTYFNKKGTEVSQARDSDDENIRRNWAYMRKYGIFAFTDENWAVKLTKGTGN